MSLYHPESTLRAARERYFDLNNFAGGGYEEGWVKMRAGPIPIWFPNTVARVKAVRFHDLHHVLTEYPTTWRGEAEIGAWEVATGCAAHYQGWLLNLLAFAIGLLLNPRGVYRAFMRGRQSRNLYRATFSEELLARKVGDVRRELGLDKTPAPPAPADQKAFIFWSLVSAGVFAGTWAMALLPLAVLGLLVFVLAHNKCLTF
ncbi:MAG: ubiquinone biosynthesis protein COQ4 [Acidobacteria bacterium]|nr:ubiquinone biosynthesis protein COQ4 [Acidobacteriota bacterium]